MCDSTGEMCVCSGLENRKVSLLASGIMLRSVSPNDQLLTFVVSLNGGYGWARSTAPRGQPGWLPWTAGRSWMCGPATNCRQNKLGNNAEVGLTGRPTLNLCRQLKWWLQVGWADRPSGKPGMVCPGRWIVQESTIHRRTTDQINWGIMLRSA